MTRGFSAGGPFWNMKNHQIDLGFAVCDEKSKLA
jgi:hypothetical protein